MHYHISTGLILQEFPKGSECPVCEIRAIVEKQIVDQFLNEAVMVDNYRDKVNKRGFCAHHYDMLLAGNSKLGVALQAITRMKALAGNVTVPKNAKDAARQADAIDKAGETCLICDLIDFNMQRYYKTIAQMYGNEREFPAMLAGTKGFCFHHYAELLRNAKEAGGKVKDYIQALAETEEKNLSRMNGELQWFCDKHDYRNREKPLGASADALPRSRTKFYGKKTI